MPRVTSSQVLVAARKIFASAPLGARLLQSLRPYICPFEALLLHVPEGAHVLDAGCGAGLFLGLVASFDPAARGHGFDTSSAAISAAERMAVTAKLSDRLRFELWNATQDWPACEVDVVSLIDVLHHVPVTNHRSVIETALSRLKPGGVLIYKDMVCKPAWRAEWNRLHDLVLARQWINYRPIEDVNNWARAAGAMQVAHGSVATGPYGHEYSVFRV